MNTPFAIFRSPLARWRTLCGAVSLLCLLFIAGCTTPMRSNLKPFPPMASDNPPGASPEALRAVKGLARGVNFGNMLEAPNEGDWGLIVNRGFIDATVAAGFTSVRLPVRWSNHAQPLQPFTLDAPFARRVEIVIDALLAKDVYVVLNMHHYRQLDGDAPDAGDLPVDAGLADERFLTMWQQIAQRFMFKSDRLIFELYNEPHGRLDAARWNDLMARALAVVRQHNPKRAVIVGPTHWNNAKALEALRLPNDPHLIASIHHYEPFAFTHQGASWIKPELPKGVACCSAAQQLEITAPLDVAKAWSVKNNYPVYLGEFGAFNVADLESRANFTRQVRQEAESRGFAWSYWELASGFGVYDPTAKAFRQPLLRALMEAEPAKNGKP
jgi:endoglucanase